MTDLTNEAEKSRKTKKTLFSLALGGVAGFLGAFGFLQLADTGALSELGASREIAALVGVIYLLTAVAVLVGVVAARVGSTYLNVEDAEELREQKAMLGLSGIGTAALGAALIVAALAAPDGPIGEDAALAVFLVLLALCTYTSIASHRRQDELMRAVGSETAATGFYLLFSSGGGWSLAAHLGYLSGPQPLDWLTTFWALTLLAAFVVTGRRGMLKMRIAGMPTTFRVRSPIPRHAWPPTPRCPR